MSSFIYRLYLTCGFLLIGLAAIPIQSTKLDSLFAVWHNTSYSDSSRLLAIADIAWEGYLFSQPDSAAYYAQLQYDFAKACLAGESEDKAYFKEQMGEALNTIGSAYYLQGRYEEALASYEESLSLRRAIEKPSLVASSLRNIATIHSEMGDFPVALGYMRESLAIFEGIDDLEGQASVHNNMGIAFKAQGLYAEATESYSKALSIFRQSDKKRHVATALNNIANIHRIMEDIPTAASYFQQSLEIREEIDDVQGVVTSLNNLGRLHLKAHFNLPVSQDASEDLELARSFFQRAHALATNMSFVKEEALSLNGLGQIALSESYVDSAITCFEGALSIRQGLNKKAGISSSLNLLAQAHLEKGTKSEIRIARDYANEALELAQSIDHLIQVEEASNILHRCYKDLGQTELALAMHELYVDTRDSLMSERNQKAVIHQQYRSSYEKQALTDSLEMLVERQVMADRERSLTSELSSKSALILGLATALGVLLLLILIYRLNQRKKKLESIAEINALRLDSNESEMKALRSQMKPHFIFNALQSIQSFLLEQDTEQASEYLLKFSKLMRLVLENSEENEVPIKKECEALELYMQLESIRLKHPFSYDIDIADAVDEESERIPPLILQPLVENAIWHGLQHKSESGHIQIKIEQDEESIVCVVEDNGIGREAVANLKQNYSIKKESMGMRITMDRLRVRNELNQTHSSVEIIDLKDEQGQACGTRVELSMHTAE